MSTTLATLLQLVASLLLIVQGNPSISDSQKQQIISFANQSIQMATQSVTTQSSTTSQSTPSTMTTTSSVTTTSSGAASVSTIAAAGASSYITPEGEACRMDLIAQNTGILMMPVNYVCGTIHRYFVGKIDYTGADGKCYHSDWTGTTVMACANPNVLPTLPAGGVPTPDNTSVGADFWTKTNAHCYYTQGDTNGTPYGASKDVFCGMSTYANKTVTIFTPAGGTSTGGGNNGGAVGSDWLTLESLGTKVSSDSPVSGFAPSCNQTYMSTGYGLHAYQGPSTDAACRTVGKAWVGSIDYKNGNGQCLHTDWTGTYQIDCAKLQSAIGVAPAALPGGVLPTDATASLNWSSYNAKCYYTNSQAGSSYGTPTLYQCGQALSTNPNTNPGLPITSVNPAIYHPGYDSARDGQYSDAQSAANPHTADFLATLVYSDPSGACYFYNYSGATPSTTAIPCPSPKPVVETNVSALSPYNTTLYGQDCTAMHVHMPNQDGGSSTKVISPIICGTAYGLPATPAANYTPGYDPLRDGQYSDAQSAANPHTADFLATLVYSDNTGACFFYNYSGSAPTTTAIPCPSPRPAVETNVPALSPYDSSLYGQNATCMHVHLPNQNGGSSTKVISPIICGTAYGLPPAQTSNYTPGYDPLRDGQYSDAQSAANPHTADFLATLVYSDSSGKCYFYNYSGAAPTTTSVPCPSPMPNVQANVSALTPYDSSLYGQNATCMHVHLPTAGSSSTKVISPIVCGTAYGLPAAQTSNYTPGYDPLRDGQYTDSQSAANPHTADFLATLVYSDNSGSCYFYNYSGAAPSTTSIPCPSPRPVVETNVANIGPYDTSLYGQNATCMHVHMPNQNGGSSTKVISPIVCGTAYGLPNQTVMPGSSCWRNSDCNAGQLCFGVGPSNPGTCN